jgi:hypothetical protein
VAAVIAEVRPPPVNESRGLVCESIQVGTTELAQTRMSGHLYVESERPLDLADKVWDR